MHTVTTLNEWQSLKKQLNNQSIGFVPTMGNLHAGHASLFERSLRENTVTVVSIFVNPTQFNEVSDYQNYPKTLAKDEQLLKALKVDYLLLPSVADLYPDNYEIQVCETYFSKFLEGEYRPGHFNGMLTVVLKLLNLVLPNFAYFGEKDYQQLLLVKKMVNALLLPVQIIGCETVRATDGLALSSRNSRLTEKQRQHAAHFPRLLKSDRGIEQIIHELKLLGFRVDYITEKWQRRLGAVWLENVRLIDNISMENLTC